MKQDSEKVILYLSKNFRKKITLAEIAKVANKSPFHFHRQFVAENNCTPQKYLEQIRMQHATHLLAAFPHWSLTDVAFDCGYSSPGIFSRAFKNFYGIPPSQHQPNNDIAAKKSTEEQTKPIDIQYLTKKTIAVKKVSLLEGKLNLAYQQLINKTASNSTLYGFYMDVPFHVPLEKCRYFIGLETNLSEKDASVITISSGYYTTLSIQGGFMQLKDKLVAINKKIQERGYALDSLMGHEKIIVTEKNIPFNYLKTMREIFIKIKRV